MPASKTCYKVVLASPGDVPEEREVVEQVISEINNLQKHNGIGFDLYRWETDAYPAFHPLGPQGVIDQQLKIGDADIFVGIFYLKFGTPTIDSNSGTEHELKQAISAFEAKGSPEIKLYFKKAITINLEEVDILQFNQVKEFKKSVLPKGIISEFETKESLEKQLRNHLHMFLNKMHDVHGLPIGRSVASYPKPSIIFTGRNEELCKFKDAFGKFNFISIEGLGGNGKTEFAAKCIEDFVPKDKVVWFDCVPESKLDGLIDSAGYPAVLKGENKTELAKYSGFTDMIERDSKILFLDNFQDVIDSSFRDFFMFSDRRLRNAKVILITRELPAAGVRVSPIELKGLKDDAISYAEKLIETFYCDVKVGENDLKNICESVDGHPLAIELAIQLLRYGETTDNIISKIVETPKGEELSKILLSEVFNHPKSTEDEKLFMLHFSIFRGEVNKEAMAYMLNDNAISETLRKLIDKKMIVYFSDIKLYGTHPLVREFCYQKIEDKRGVHLKAAIYLKTKRNFIFDPTLKKEIFYHLFAGLHFDMAADLISETGESFILSGHTNTLKEMAGKIISSGIERPEFYVFYGDIATICGEWNNALSYFEKAFLFTGVAEKIMAEAFIKYGEILFRRGDVRESLKFFEGAYETCKKNGYKKEEARSLNDIGLVYHTFGDLSLAESKLNDSLELRKNIGDKKGIADTLNNISLIFSDRGEFNQALEKLFESIDVLKGIPALDGIALYLCNTINLLRRMGQLDSALDKCKESLKIAEEIGDKFTIIACLNNFGAILKDKGQRKDALEKYNEGLSISKMIGSKQGIAVSLINRGSLFVEGDRLKDALADYNESLRISKEVGHRLNVAVALDGIAGILSSKHKWAEALAKHNESLLIFEQIGDRQGYASVRNNIGNVYTEMGKWDEALINYAKSSEIAMAINDKRGVAIGCRNIAFCHFKKKQYRVALKNFLESIAMQKQIGLLDRDTSDYVTEIRKILGGKRFKELTIEISNELPIDLRKFISIDAPIKENKIYCEHEKVGRNDPCFCGSGKKYKKCCGKPN